MRTTLALDSLKKMNEILTQRGIQSDYELDPYKAFSQEECTQTIDFGTGALFKSNPFHRKIYTLSGRQTVCVIGSILIGSNSSHTAITKLPAKGSGSYYWEQTKVVQDALAVLAEFNIKYEDLFVDLYNVIAPPVTKIWCTDGRPCKIQLASLMPSFKFTYEQQGIKMVSGVRSVVSTKAKGGFKVGIETQTSSKTIIADTVYGLSISKGMKSYSYKRDEYADFSSFSEIEEKRKLVKHTDYKGNYGHYLL